MPYVVSPFMNRYFQDLKETFFPPLFMSIIFRHHFLLVFQDIFMTTIAGFFSTENFSKPFLLFHTHFIPCKCFSGRLYYSFLTFSHPFHFVRVIYRYYVFYSIIYVMLKPNKTHIPILKMLKKSYSIIFQ